MRATRKKYLIDIERLTGLTILLVVVGHLVTGQDINAPGLEWYKFLKRYIYSFHMPLFMFVSGFLFYYTLPKFSNKKDYWHYVRKKIIRLFPSYLIFSMIIFIAKLLLSNHLEVDNNISGFNEFFMVLYNPVRSFAGSLWYVYVLFQFYLIFPIILKYLKPLVVLFISFPLYYVKLTDLFAVNFFLEFLFFFSLGVFIADNYEKYKALLLKYGIPFMLLFVGLSISFYFTPIPKIVMGLCSVPALHTFVLLIKNPKYKLLSTLGAFSFSIYLMNTLVMGLVKAVGFKFFEISYSNFLFIALIMVFLGSIIPILIKKYIINKIPKIGKYIG